MAQTSKRGRLSPLGSAMAHLQLGRFAQARPVTGLRAPKATPRVDPGALARAAGDRGTSAEPTDNARRALNYLRQRDTTGAHPPYQLTPAQSRRLRKHARGHVGVTASGPGKAFG